MSPTVRSALFSLIPGPLDVIAKRTFVNDCLRQFSVGLLDTGPRAFFLLIAVQRFSAGDLWKTLVSVPGAAGMTLSVLLVPALARLPVRKSTLLAAGRALSGMCFFAAAAFPALEAYVFWVFMAALPTSLTYPLLTAVYHENYPRRLRGQLFAWAAMVNTGCSLAWYALIGHWLGTDSARYRPVLVLFGAASLLAAWSLHRIPSPARQADPAAAPGQTPAQPATLAAARRLPLGFLSAFRWVWHDRAFGYMLGVWFLFGFALMMINPLKVLYLTESRYGLTYPAAKAALILGILPETMRLLATPVWARLFDRYNFVGIRMGVNVIILLALVAFFWGRSFPWLCVSAVLEGLSLAGGNIAWALWVTHMAPPRHTAEYMAVHQFFTGVRGIIGALLGIHFASRFGLMPVAWISVGLVLLSVALMAPVRENRRWRKAEGGSQPAA